MGKILNIIIFFFLCAWSLNTIFENTNETITINDESEKAQIEYKNTEELTSQTIPHYSQTKIYYKIETDYGNQFLIPEPYFNSTIISFYINYSSCHSDFSPVCKIELNQVKSALSYMENSTGNMITFNEITDPDFANIIIHLNDDIDKANGMFEILGEGGPETYYEENGKSLIIRGSLNFYKADGCYEPKTAIHELGHVFGFNHVDNYSNIMFPEHSNCFSIFNQEQISYLRNTYGPNIEITNDIAIKENGDYELLIENIGQNDAYNIKIETSSKNQQFSPDNIDRLGKGSVIRLKFNDKNISNNLNISIEYENFNKIKLYKNVQFSSN